MSSTFFEVVLHELESITKTLSLNVESLLAILRAPETGKILPDECAKAIAMATDISLRIDDMKVKINADLKLGPVILEIRKDLKDQRHGLVSWLRSREHTDAVEDARLTGDRDRILQVELEGRAARRRCLMLTSEHLVLNLHLLHCTRRLSLYMQRYQGIANELATLAEDLVAKLPKRKRKRGVP
ncbi:hypothetical protein Daus18300_007020 [Diaporthe australafricana]|uniref:Uncharacterized protein n=1 Tax=Diaporthe australafricana TaxID=127596 RepID=A0ABR3WQG9_9PEZI